MTVLVLNVSYEFVLVHTDIRFRLSIAEMQAKLEFDKDKDGVVSPEEAQVS